MKPRTFGCAAALVGVLAATIVSSSAGMPLLVRDPAAGVLQVATPDTAPGLRITVTQAGLTAAADAIVPILNKALAKPIVLPARTLSVKVPLLGTITVDLTSITISGLAVPALSLEALAPSGMNGAIGGLSIEVDVPFTWRQKDWPHIHGHNSVTAGGTGGNIAMAFEVSAGPAGKPHVTITSDSCSFAHFDIKVHGTGGWIFNVFLSLFNGVLKKAVDDAVSKAIATAVPDALNKALADMHTVTEIFGGVSRVDLNYGLQGVNSSTQQYLSLGDLLSITDNMTGVACPLPPAVLPVVAPKHPANHLQIMLADSFVSCLGWVQYANDALHLDLPHSALPTVLNTSFWNGVVPGLEKALPGAAMGVEVTLRSTPGIHTSVADGIVGAADVGLNFSVAEGATGHMVHSHSLDARFAFGASLAVTDHNNTATLMFNVTTLSLNMTGIDSSFGPMNTAGLDGMFAAVLPLVKDIINGLLAKGIPLPGAPTGAGAANVAVDMGEGYFAISFDLKFADATETAPLAKQAEPAGRFSLRGALSAAE